MSGSLYRPFASEPEEERISATFLSPQDAALLGEYESWLSAQKLHRQMRCRECGPDQDVLVSVEPHQIGIACHHRMLVFQGAIPFRETVHPELGESVSVVRETIPDVPIAPVDAFMLQRYRQFLQTYGFQEALWCLQCEDEGNPGGCKAWVRPTEMVILCRCQRRMYTEALH